MTACSRSLLAAAVGLWLTQHLPGQEPGRLGLEPTHPTPAVNSPLSANQQTANTIAEHLRQSGQLRQYTVDIVYHDGVAELSGAVADQNQRDEVLRLVQGVPAVERVRDHLTLGSITQAKGLEQQPAGEPPPPPAPLAGPPLGVGAAPGRQTDPVPAFQGQPPSPYDLNPPHMPPYAWPTYAPYNNFSRVAYPQLYPYNAWPFIGPAYPFPKIPLSWRKVSLEWQDGYWWYGTHSNCHDWWRLRYW